MIVITYPMAVRAIYDAGALSYDADALDAIAEMHGVTRAELVHDVAALAPRTPEGATP